MATTTSNRFLTKEYVQTQKTLTDEKTTQQILRIISDANRSVILSLIPIKDNIILDGTTFFADAQNVAMLYFDSEYERLILKLPDESDQTFKRYKERRNLLIDAIKAQPGESKRFKPATASCSYQSDLLSSIPEITDKDGKLF